MLMYVFNDRGNINERSIYIVRFLSRYLDIRNKGSADITA